MSHGISNRSFQLTENAVSTSEQRVGHPIHHPVDIAGLRMKSCAYGDTSSKICICSI